jgi:hypothetical protein
VSASNIFFCAIAEAYFSGLTNGTTATTYSPTQAVPREQMAAFVTRTLDQSLQRGSRRAAIGKWWMPKSVVVSGILHNSSDSGPQLVCCDGNSLWVAWEDSSTVSRHSLNGDYDQIKRWTGAFKAYGIVSDGHTAWMTSFYGGTGSLYRVFPNSSTAEPQANNLPPNPAGIACDGESVWTANFGISGSQGSISRFTFGGVLTSYFTGFDRPLGILFDGENLWVTDPGGSGNARLKRVNPANGAVTLDIELPGMGSGFPVFDGTNVWVPNFFSNTVSVVRAKGALAGTILATLSGNGLNLPASGAFDGERILFTNNGASETSVSLWKAADLTPIGNTVISNYGGKARGACSDGTNFYISVQTSNINAFKILRL